MNTNNDEHEIFEKAKKSIQSCTTLPQLRSAEVMIKNIEKTHEHLVFDLKCYRQMKLQELTGKQTEHLDFNVIDFEIVSPNEKS